MVSQKRKRFLIKQKRLRQEKRKKFHGAFNNLDAEVRTIYNQVNHYQRLQKSLSVDEVANLKVLLLKARQRADAFQALALKSEHLFTPIERYRIRHSVPERMKFIWEELKEMKKNGAIGDESVFDIMKGFSGKKQNP